MYKYSDMQTFGYLHVCIKYMSEYMWRQNLLCNYSLKLRRNVKRLFYLSCEYSVR